MNKVNDSALNSNESNDKSKTTKGKENEWSNPIEFLMTCIGSKLKKPLLKFVIL